MSKLRCLARDRRHLAALLLALVLALRLAVPGGFMPVEQRGHLAFIACSGTAAMPAMPATDMAMPNASHRGAHPEDHHPAPTQPPCAFAGLSMASLAGMDPVVLAGPLAFRPAVAARWPLPRLALPGAAHLRPPAQAPPHHL